MGAVKEGRRGQCEALSSDQEEMVFLSPFLEEEQGLERLMPCPSETAGESCCQS